MTKHQQTVSAGSRLYYFDVREDSKGNNYISIAEMNTRTKKRNGIFIHAEHLDNFRKALDEISPLIKNDSER